ncbi:MAG TPA: heat-inducible transcriptional repressor HrcA [Candidatus Hydrogenedentes bacterium]|nr:heat-inducible transcriptional repressor HrcA [Candidatus Hydrogenedentota bacterium]
MMRQAPELNEREATILHAVVHSYITTAEPVGSRTVVKRFALDLSPATVRNTMADLEEQGYLQQVHTSSGRVPTDRGYRYYVDYLMRVQELTGAERERIEVEYAQRLNDADEVLKQTSHLLALITHQAGIAEAPSERAAVVKRLELMPVTRDRMAVLLVDNYGRVRSMMVQTERELDADHLPTLNQFLNDHLNGVAVDGLSAALNAKLRNFLDEQRRLAEEALQVLSLMPAQRSGQVFLEGATQLFEQPEFRDIERAREVFGLLEERDRLVDLLRSAAMESERTRGSVLIGAEFQGKGVEGISVVASPYHVDGQPVGAIGVLGPRRMPYPRLTAIVDYTASMVGRILTRLGG